MTNSKGMFVRREAPTLKDVAAAAGVSLATAARVLRKDKYPVDKALAQRVEEAAARLGYVPNVLARNLRSGAPTMVGLVVGDMIEPYYSEIAEAITQHAEAAHGILAIVCNMQRNPLLELKYCQQLWENRVAGLVLAGGGFDQVSKRTELRTLLERMIGSGVIVTSLAPRGFPLHEFCADNKEVGRMVGRALLEHGHREIGVIAGSGGSAVTRLRLEGLNEVLKAAEVDPVIAYSEMRQEVGATVVMDLLKRKPDITGFIVGSDTIAFGVLRGLEVHGLRVPQDASVVSIGNTQMAKMSLPRLTTVDVQLAEYGRSALDFIVERVNGRDNPEKPVFPLSLYPGDTLGPPRRS